MGISRDPSKGLNDYEMDLISTWVLTLVLVLLVLISVLGNLLVVIAVKTDKNLRKLSNLFLVSLAIADLLVALFVMPFAIINDMTGKWPLGERECKIWISSDVMCSTASILSLCVISLDRYIRIKDPLQYTQWITRKSVPVILSIVWTISGLISFFPIMMDLHTTNEFSDMNKTDSGDQEQEIFQCLVNFSPVFSITSSCISFLLPCVVMIGIYLKLWTIGRGHVKNIKASHQLARNVELRLHGCKLLAKVKQDPEKSGDSAVREGSERRQSTKVKSPSYKTSQHQVSYSLVEEHKATITVGVIMGVFLLCWVPFFITNIVNGLCKDCVSPTLFKVLTWLGYSNSAFNPVIYSIFNSEFREGFRRILFDRRCSVP